MALDLSQIIPVTGYESNLLLKSFIVDCRDLAFFLNCVFFLSFLSISLCPPSATPAEQAWGTEAGI